MMNGYPFFHKNHNQLAFTAIAIQEPDYTYDNPKTGKKFTIPELYYFAKNYLGANAIFWNIQEPQFSEKVLPFLEKIN